MDRERIVLRMTGRQQQQLQDHLFPGDDMEAVAILLCGRRIGVTPALGVHKVELIPLDICDRGPGHIQWPVEHILPLLEEAETKGLAVVKIHSHPGGFDQFSAIDDRADQELFPGIYALMDNDQPHGSAIMLPNGTVFGRVAGEDGCFQPFEKVIVAGDDIQVWPHDAGGSTLGEASLRTIQTFGEGTTRLLQQLSVAVIGVSGTGGPVVEQLARYGVRELVLVDPDTVEEKNLNRIPNATLEDAYNRAAKVEVQARAIRAMGLGTTVISIAKDLHHPDVVKRVAECDVIFGCMDGVEGRHVLNKIASTYVQPYIDIGVRIDPDGHGGVEDVMFTVHYLQPDGSSLLSRGVYTLEECRAEALQREDPENYQKLRQEGYVHGVDVERPAVVSINTLAASTAVMELLARLHPYRSEPNSKYATVRLTHGNMMMIDEGEGARCQRVTRTLGRGDMRPLLGMPALDQTPALKQSA